MLTYVTYLCNIRSIPILVAASREAKSNLPRTPEMPPETDEQIASGLLDYLRASLKVPSLSYAETPARITGGFETSVFGFRLAGAPEPLCGRLILRLFARAQDPERARGEA